MEAARERPWQFSKSSHTRGCCGWKLPCAISAYHQRLLDDPLHGQGRAEHCDAVATRGCCGWKLHRTISLDLCGCWTAPSTDRTLSSMATPLESMEAAWERPSQNLKSPLAKGCRDWKLHCATALDSNDCWTAPFSVWAPPSTETPSPSLEATWEALAVPEVAAHGGLLRLEAALHHLVGLQRLLDDLLHGPDSAEHRDAVAVHGGRLGEALAVTAVAAHAGLLRLEVARYPSHQPHICSQPVHRSQSHCRPKGGSLPDELGPRSHIAPPAAPRGWGGVNQTRRRHGQQPAPKHTRAEGRLKPRQEGGTLPEPEWRP